MKYPRKMFSFTCVKVFNMSLDSTSRHLAKYNVVKYNVN